MFGYSNFLYTHIIKVIINHTFISEYRLRFFSRKKFKYLCSLYSIKLRYHILHEYDRFNKFKKELFKLFYHVLGN